MHTNTYILNRDTDNGGLTIDSTSEKLGDLNSGL